MGLADTLTARSQMFHAPLRSLLHCISLYIRTYTPASLTSSHFRPVLVVKTTFHSFHAP